MPELQGGFSLGRSMREAAGIMDFVDEIQRRRRERENPLARALGPREKASEMIGGDLEEHPELFTEVMRMTGIEDPQQIERVRSTFGGIRSRVRQKRVMDFQENLAKILQQSTDQENQDAVMMNMFESDPRSKSDPLIGGLISMYKQRAGQSKMALLQNLMIGYKDIMHLPEVQAMIKAAQAQAILGPGGSPGRVPPAPSPGRMPKEEEMQSR